jgi:hypothetical protein
MSENVHIVASGDGRWSVRKESADRASTVVGTKKEALREARYFAKEGQVNIIVHKEDGRIWSVSTLPKASHTSSQG